MTPKKRLFKLKKELRRVQNKWHKYIKKEQRHYQLISKNILLPINDKTITAYSFPKNIKSYEIFTTVGTAYIIDSTLKDFPIIDYSKICYICRRYINTNYNYDSLNGFHNRTNNYEQYVYKRFNVINIDNFDLDRWYD